MSKGKKVSKIIRPKTNAFGDFVAFKDPELPDSHEVRWNGKLIHSPPPTSAESEVKKDLAERVSDLCREFGFEGGAMVMVGGEEENAKVITTGLSPDALRYALCAAITVTFEMDHAKTN